MLTPSGTWGKTRVLKKLRSQEECLERYSMKRKKGRDPDNETRNSTNKKLGELL